MKLDNGRIEVTLRPAGYAASDIIEHNCAQDVTSQKATCDVVAPAAAVRIGVILKFTDEQSLGDHEAFVMRIRPGEGQEHYMYGPSQDFVDMVIPGSFLGAWSTREYVFPNVDCMPRRHPRQPRALSMRARNDFVRHPLADKSDPTPGTITVRVERVCLTAQASRRPKNAIRWVSASFKKVRTTYLFEFRPRASGSFRIAPSVNAATDGHAGFTARGGLRTSYDKPSLTSEEYEDMMASHGPWATQQPGRTQELEGDPQQAKQPLKFCDCETHRALAQLRTRAPASTSIKKTPMSTRQTSTDEAEGDSSEEQPESNAETADGQSPEHASNTESAVESAEEILRKAKACTKCAGLKVPKRKRQAVERQYYRKRDGATSRSDPTLRFGQGKVNDTASKGGGQTAPSSEDVDDEEVLPTKPPPNDAQRAGVTGSTAPSDAATQGQLPEASPPKPGAPEVPYLAADENAAPHESQARPATGETAPQVAPPTTPTRSAGRSPPSSDETAETGFMGNADNTATSEVNADAVNQSGENTATGTINASLSTNPPEGVASAPQALMQGPEPAAVSKSQKLADQRKQTLASMKRSHTEIIDALDSDSEDDREVKRKIDLAKTREAKMAAREEWLMLEAEMEDKKKAARKKKQTSVVVKAEQVVKLEE